jgi:serine/threonine protein kinase
MSPEHFRNEPLTPKSDIFALGLVLYEASTGSHPFPPGSLFEVLHALATFDPEAPSCRNTAIEPAFNSLILAMLGKEPAQRPTAAEVSEQLKRIRSGLNAASADRYAVRVPEAEKSLSWPPFKRMSRAVRHGIVLALGALVAAVALLFPRRPVHPPRDYVWLRYPEMLVLKPIPHSLRMASRLRIRGMAIAATLTFMSNRLTEARLTD